MAMKVQGGRMVPAGGGGQQSDAERYVQMEIQKFASALSGLWNSPQRKQLDAKQQAKLKVAVDALSDLYFRDLR